MSAFFVTVTGKKSSPVGITFRESERGDPVVNFNEAVGSELKPFTNIFLCREGNESLIPASKGTKCTPGLHGVKEGTPIYDLGISKACPKHLHLMPTLGQLREKYTKIWFFDVQFSVNKEE